MTNTNIRIGSPNHSDDHVEVNGIDAKDEPMEDISDTIQNEAANQVYGSSDSLQRENGDKAEVEEQQPDQSII